jgi:hypothetical protein
MTINPIYARFPEPTRPRGFAHQQGTCGGHADLCYTCERLELSWHLRVAEAIAVEYPPIAADETPSNYWHRINGSFIDTWWAAACHALDFAARKVA